MADSGVLMEDQQEKDEVCENLNEINCGSERVY